MMKSTIRKNYNYKMPKNTNSISEVYTVEFWRESLDNLIIKLDGESFIGALIKGDSYYDSHQGNKDYKNLTMHRASLPKTQRACTALQNYLSRKNKQQSTTNKVIKRQGLKL